MGLDIVAASLILHEHKFRPISGRVLTIGRQSIGFPPRQLNELMRLLGVERRQDHVYIPENKTIGVTSEYQSMSQESFFGAFTDAEVCALDVSDYEGAEIVCDLQGNVPKQYHGFANFIYNGSCLDNIFDAAAAIRNMTLLLSPNGRIYHYEQGSSHPTAYLKYSADWFMDYYVYNDFADCKAYIVDKPNSIGVPLIQRPDGARPQMGPRRAVPAPHNITVFNFNPYVRHATGEGYDCSSIEVQTRYEIHCIAEKKPTSTFERSPVQKHYLVDEAQKRFNVQKAKEFLHHPRPVFSNGEPFNSEVIGRIDSSDYPEVIRLVAVIPNHI